MSGELGVHWEASVPPSSPEAANVQWEIIRRFHISKGYADIAYSFGVDDFGQIHQGRGWDRDTAANGPGHNQGNRAVCWLGGPEFSPSPQAYEAATQVVHEGFARGFSVVRPHSDYVPTQCPGDDWRAWVEAQGWTGSSGSEETELGEALDTIGQWEQDTRKIILDAQGQWEQDTRAQIIAAVNAHTDEALAGLSIEEGPGGGLSEAQVRQIVREELDRTKLGA